MQYRLGGECSRNEAGHELDAIGEGCRHCDMRRLQHLFVPVKPDLKPIADMVNKLRDHLATNPVAFNAFQWAARFREAALKGGD